MRELYKLLGDAPMTIVGHLVVMDIERRRDSPVIEAAYQAMVKDAAEPTQALPRMSERPE